MVRQWLRSCAGEGVVGEARWGQDITLERLLVMYIVQSPCMMQLWDARRREEEGLRDELMGKKVEQSVLGECGWLTVMESQSLQDAALRRP